MANEKKLGFVKAYNVLVRSPYMSAQTKVVLLNILSRNPSFPGYKRLLKEAKVSKATLSKAIKELVTRNILRVSRSDRALNQYYPLPVDEWNLGQLVQMEDLSWDELRSAIVQTESKASSIGEL